MSAYYNENDAFAAAWLRELIKAGLIADGEVDERSIELVRPEDLRGFVQCHFFAGIGGWSYALRLAGWPDDRAVWTGSCPCQPFSGAGKGDGASDSRHLWPAWFQLIKQCRPRVCFGEQVASADGLGWIDRVSADMEAESYALGAFDLCAPGIGAFHIRQRLWFVADSERTARWPLVESGTDDLDEIKVRPEGSSGTGERVPFGDERCGCWDRNAFHRTVGMLQGERCVNKGSLDDTERERTGRSTGSEGRAERTPSRGRQDEGRGLVQTLHAGAVDIVGHANGTRLQASRPIETGTEWWDAGRAAEPASQVPHFWSDAVWIPCLDGKARPVEPLTFPLAHGVSGRVAIRMPIESAESEIQEHWYNRTGALKGFGNAIVPQVAQVFIEAYMSLNR